MRPGQPSSENVVASAGCLRSRSAKITWRPARASAIGKVSGRSRTPFPVDGACDHERPSASVDIGEIDVRAQDPVGLRFRSRRVVPERELVVPASARADAAKLWQSQEHAELAHVPDVRIERVAEERKPYAQDEAQDGTSAMFRAGRGPTRSADSARSLTGADAALSASCCQRTAIRSRRWRAAIASILPPVDVLRRDWRALRGRTSAWRLMDLLVTTKACAYAFASARARAGSWSLTRKSRVSEAGLGRTVDMSRSSAVVGPAPGTRCSALRRTGVMRAISASVWFRRAAVVVRCHCRRRQPVGRREYDACSCREGRLLSQHDDRRCEGGENDCLHDDPLAAPECR